MTRRLRGRAAASTPGDCSSGAIYAPLDKDVRQIRLLWFRPTDKNGVIHVGLQPVELDLKPSYEALSYVWGDGSVTEQISVNGQLLPVPINLAAALRQFSNEDRMLREHFTSANCLWVDAICINQNDIAEKGQQIAIMGDIYRNAKRVRVWLGHMPDGVADAMRKLVEEATSPHAVTTDYFPQELMERTSREGEQGTQPEIRRRLVGMLSRGESPDSFTEKIRHVQSAKYWTRKWIVQELAFADVIRFCLGRDQIDLGYTDCRVELKNLCVLLELAGLHGWHDPEGPEGSDSSHVYCHLASSIFAIVMGSSDMRFVGLFSDGKTDFDLMTIQACRSFEATNPLDCVFAVQGMLDSRLHLLVDYDATVTDLFTKFTVNVARNKGSLRILEQACSAVSDLPSWVPDLRHADLDFGSEDWRPSLVDSTECKWNENDPQVLEVPALVFDEIAAVPDLSNCPERKGHEWVKYIYTVWNDQYMTLANGTEHLVDTPSFWNNLSLRGVAPNPDYFRAFQNTFMAVIEDRYPADKEWWIHRVFNRFLVYYVLFFTTAGRIGHALKASGKIERGDKMVIIPTSTVVFCARAVDGSTEESYKLVNPCYVDGKPHRNVVGLIADCT